MGRRGPAPAPTSLKLRRGEEHRDRLNFREPDPRAVLPRFPSGLDSVAGVVWRRTLRDMPVGVIRSVDTDVLRIYCEAVSRYRRAQREYHKVGPLVAGRDGNLVKNPLHQVVRDNADLIRLLARELGLSPSARFGLQIEMGAGATDTGLEDEIGPPPRFRVVGGDD